MSPKAAHARVVSRVPIGTNFQDYTSLFCAVEICKPFSIGLSAAFPDLKTKFDAVFFRFVNVGTLNPM
jgi:hypothetical protein